MYHYDPTITWNICLVAIIKQINLMLSYIYEDNLCTRFWFEGINCVHEKDHHNNPTPPQYWNTLSFYNIQHTSCLSLHIAEIISDVVISFHTFLASDECYPFFGRSPNYPVYLSLLCTASTLLVLAKPIVPGRCKRCRIPTWYIKMRTGTMHDFLPRLQSNTICWMKKKYCIAIINLLEAFLGGSLKINKHQC